MAKGFLISVLVFLLAASACAQSWGPWEAPEQKQTAFKAQPNALETAIKLFQQHISKVDGPRCPMYPTCSAYGLQAVNKHGAVVGTFMVVDRLYREQDSKQISQRKIAKYGYIRFFDSLSDNDFWLQAKSKSHTHQENR